ncbi:MAG: hypothetical protein GDA67_06980 [Nitrospira sp. CR1.3]|nr:hypothetical protein [Nitrospira sp. CR1.3]
MRRAGKMVGAVLLGGLIAACSATDGVEKRDAATNPPTQIAEAAAPGDGSPSTTEEGDVSSRLVLPDDPCRYNPGMRCRAYRDRLASKLPTGTGLMVPAPPQVPPPPSNGGQCVIDITGQINDTVTSQGTTTVTRIVYRHTEIQRWEVSGPPRQEPGIVGKVYSMQWSTIGNGSKDQTNSSTASSGQSHTDRYLRVWDFRNGGGPLTTRLTVFLRTSDNQWVINHANLPNVVMVAPLTDQQQHTGDGVMDPIRSMPGQWPEFPASFPWTESGNLTQVVNRMQSFPIGVANGYAQIAPPAGKGSLTGGAQCVWNLKLVP